METILGRESNKYRRVIRRIKQKVAKVKEKIQLKNKKKTDRYLAKHEEEKRKEEISNLPAECLKYLNLRPFNNINIQPEPPKPPVVCDPNIKLSRGEIKLLSKNPKYALRAMLNKEKCMNEVEKYLIKEKYGRIGKSEKNCKVSEEDGPETKEEKLQEEHAKWLERKCSLIYDLEDDTMDFGRNKATNMKGNKRITLPKSGTPSLEAYFEIRRQHA